MNEIEQDILDSLLELERAAKGPRDANRKPDFQGLFARLEHLAQRLPRSTDPLLRHYLHMKSYEKARLLLQGRDAENAPGTCGEGKAREND